MIKSAGILGPHRYWLTRVWDQSLEILVFAMLNPSTADADLDDATVRKCIGFARRLGFGGIHIVNLFAYRTRSPKKLRFIVKTSDPMRSVGYLNDNFITQGVEGRTVVRAWGGHGAHYPERVRTVNALIRRHARSVHHLGKTASGQPRHPLMLAYTTPLEDS